MMQNVIKNLVALIGVSLLGIGIANAAPSSDCGDDDVQPINIHSTAKVINKDT
jgi:hypothetical protein